ncbi:MAG: dihydroorotase [Cytophagales bacterium]|nr:dihydroorotase [Cytophagales bacterium]
MKILIKNAEILDPKSAFHQQTKNILIENGIITSVSDAETSADKVIQSPNLKVSTGWFDMRTTIGDPGYEHKETIDSALLAAAKGGFTAIAMLPCTKPVVQSKDTISYIRSKAQGYATNIYVYGALSADLHGSELTEMMDLHHAGAIAFTDGDAPIYHTGLMVRALEYVRHTDTTIIQRPEDLHLTQYGQMNEGATSTYLGLKGMPHLAEVLMIHRDLQLVKYTSGKLHFSCISSAESVLLIKHAKSMGLNISCDVAVPNLVFDDSVLLDFDTVYKLNPPLRTKADIKALWQGVNDGTIDAIVTDHRPQDTESKMVEFDMADFGMTQLETAFPALLSAKPDYVNIETIIDKMTYGPRKILAINDDTIQIGNIANITVFDTTSAWKYDENKIASKSRNSPFLNQELRGSVHAIYNNKILYENK